MQILYILNTANLVPKINKNDHFTQRKAQFTACLVLEKVIKSCVNDSFPSLKQCTFQSLKKKKRQHQSNCYVTPCRASSYAI